VRWKRLEILEKQYGVSAEIIDARSIVPFQYEKVLESVKEDRQNPAGQ
jgi:2-oxoisovalerate dehydrogenase E1 component